MNLPLYKQRGFFQLSDDTGEIWASDWASMEKYEIGDKLKVVAEIR